MDKEETINMISIFLLFALLSRLIYQRVSEREEKS